MEEKIQKALDFLKRDLKLEENAAALYGRQANEVEKGWLKKILLANKEQEETHNKLIRYAIERLEYSAQHPRIPTGVDQLDDMLYGGIPEGYAVILTSPPLDESDLLIESFIKTRIEGNEPVLYITTNLKMKIAELTKQDKNFHLFFCNPQADQLIPNAPNVHKVNSIDDLTTINITLENILSEVEEKGRDLKTVFLDILSDALLTHNIPTVRKWLGDLLTRFKSKKITTLWTLDPGMHREEAKRSVINLFDGHLAVEEKKIDEEHLNVLTIKRLYGMKYLHEDLILDKDRLAQIKRL